MKRLALAGCLALALLSAAASASAETVSLGFKQNTSSHPSAFFSPDLERAVSFQVLITATPAQPLSYGQYVSCRRGLESISVEAPDTLVSPPYSTTILPTLPEPDSCWISVSAEPPVFEDALFGTVRAEATGTRRPLLAPPPPALPAPPPAPPAPYRFECSLPGWLNSGKVKVHGEADCRAAKQITSEAWRKPKKAGNPVKVRGYSCRRNQVRNSATVRCTKGPAIIKVGGKLR